MIANGINRAEMEPLLREAVSRIAGLPLSSVYIIDDAADTVMLTPPFASILILPPGNVTSEASEHWQQSYEYWRATITETADDDYIVSIIDTDHSYTAVGKTATEIRDGLLADMPSTAEYTTAAAGTTSIDIVSLVAGQRLAIESDNVTLTQFRRSLVKVSSATVELPIEVVCFGVPGSTAWDGKSMAEVLQAGMMDPDATGDLRACGHNMLRSRVMDMSRITDGESERIGKLEMIFATRRAYINVNVGTTTSIPTSMTGSTYATE